jgi:hypothetical protein
VLFSSKNWQKDLKIRCRMEIEGAHFLSHKGSVACAIAAVVVLALTRRSSYAATIDAAVRKKCTLNPVLFWLLRLPFKPGDGLIGRQVWK